MEIDSFLKSAVVIDNVITHIKIGKRLHESRIQRLRKKTLCISFNVIPNIIIASEDPNITSLSPILIINLNTTWAMI